MNKKTAAIIVSIHDRNSYDRLFTSVQQRSKEGTKTLVYSATASAVDKLIEGFENHTQDEVALELFREIRALDADCTVFNWECSSGYAGRRFPEGAEKVMKLLSYVLANKHMAMFSDFSLKALIAEWDERTLGSNPFKEMKGGFSSTVELRFDPGALKKSPSAQLQSVGDLSEGGKSNVYSMANTITYTVDPAKVDPSRYKLQVLTVAKNVPVDDRALLCRIGEIEGAAGHVLLTYPSGGKLLTSMGHWSELMKVDTSEKKLLEVAERQYGSAEVTLLKSRISKLTGSAKYNFIQAQGNAYVQSSAPSNNIAQKTAYNQIGF